MAKMTLNELKIQIAEILDEAKKKTEKEEKVKKLGRAVEAYGFYDEAFDFSAPLGAYNRYAQQGAANFGPYTSAGTQINTNFLNPSAGTLSEQEELVVRNLVREVIQNGLVPSDSAWAPLIEREVAPGNSWQSAQRIYEAWYDEFRKKKGKEDEAPKKKAKGFEKDDEGKNKRGAVKKHGQQDDKKGK